MLARKGVAVGVVALLVTALIADASATPRLPTIGRMTTVVSLGAASAIVLDVPRDTGLSVAAFRLHLAGGRYAVARLQPLFQPKSCQASPMLGPSCLFWEFTYLRGYSDGFTQGPPGTHNFVNIPDPSDVWPGPVRVTLLTDGLATFSFGANDRELPAVRSFRATPGDLGRAALLSTHCVLPSCTDYADVRAGGQAYDVGPLGYAEYDAVAVSPQNSSLAIAGCFYPNFDDLGASPDPSAHPLGCDYASTTPLGMYRVGRRVAYMAASQVGPATGSQIYEWYGRASGRTYIGGESRTFGVSGPHRAFLAVWLRDIGPWRSF